MDRKFKDLTGLKFGFITVVAFAGGDGNGANWLCRCDCGRESTRKSSALRYVKSCGCKNNRRCTANLQRVRHGQSREVYYKAWQGMHERCSRPAHRSWKHYGGRGIRVSEKWETFEGFWEDMGSAYEPGLQIDREDNNGNYEKSNCRWVTGKVNCNNRMNSIRIFGLAISEITELFGLSKHTVYRRMKAGWSDEQILTPSDKKKRTDRKSPPRKDALLYIDGVKQK